ncbi:MAG: efflux RND transporter permease subunit, partial [Saprospiraceae bacterium]
TFRSIKETLIIFSAIPLAAIGGVGALWIRDMNFSISAGIGFIALFGVAVLNGIVLISYLNRLEKEGEKDITQRILKGTSARLRPVLITAAVASFGFLPMALSVSAGSEVQKPLATVVIGGLISSTLLTLIVLPVLYSLFFSKNKSNFTTTSVSILIIICVGSFLPAQSKAQASLLSTNTPRSELGLDSCISIALRHHPVMQSGMYAIRQQEILKKNAFTLDPFTINYQGGSINSKVNDYNLTFSGSVQYPLVYKRQAQVQRQNILLAKQQLEVSKNELMKNVSSAYYELLFTQQNYLLLRKIDSLYIHFADYAAKKYTVGESNILEKLSAETQLKQLQLQLQQAQSDIAIAQAQLNQWLGIPGDYYAADMELVPLPPPEDADTAQLFHNPVLEFEKQKMNVSIANWKLDRSRYSPSFQVGVFNQSIDKVTPFWGWDIGLIIPIVKSGKAVQSKAALLQINAEESNIQASKLSLHAAYMEALQQYKKFSESYHYFQTEGIPMSRLLISTAEKSYQSGEIEYVEYIQNINTAYTIQSQFLETIKNLNLAIININYLLNK